MRPFRFGHQVCHVQSRSHLRDLVKKTEDLGFSALFTPDHFAGIDLATGPLLAAVATLSDRLEVGALVYDNDFRHPLLLARETATLNVLSDGRAICGIGAGWHEGEYRSTGIPWDPPGQRVTRLEEALPLLKQAWSGEPFSHQGVSYTVTDYAGIPKSRPRLLVGGGAKRMLTLAGRHADIVNLNAPLNKGFGKDMVKFTDDSLPEMLDWVKAGAGERFGEIEVSVPVFFFGITDRPEEAVRGPAEEQGYTVEQAMRSPNYLFGSRAQLGERLHAYRERFGITTFIFSDYGAEVDSLAPLLRDLS